MEGRIEEFIDSEVVVRSNSGCKIRGILIAIDGYLNVVVQNAEISSDPGQTRLTSMFMKGSNVEYIALSK
jgi:small nuclear ribonucleoprotein (snRNP)-like protein